MAKKKPADPASQADDLISAGSGKTKVETGDLATFNVDSSKVAAIWEKAAKEAKADLKRANARIDTLVDVRVDHARLKQANKTKRIVLAVSALASGVGGGIMKYNAALHPEWVAAGLALILLAATLQFALSLLDG